MTIPTPDERPPSRRAPARAVNRIPRCRACICVSSRWSSNQCRISDACLSKAIVKISWDRRRPAGSFFGISSLSTALKRPRRRSRVSSLWDRPSWQVSRPGTRACREVQIFAPSGVHFAATPYPALFRRDPAQKRSSHCGNAPEIRRSSSHNAARRLIMRRRDLVCRNLRIQRGKWILFAAM